MTNDEMMTADLERLATYPRDVHLAAHHALRVWQNGYARKRAYCGICGNLDDAFDGVRRDGHSVNGYDYASGVFYALGFRSIYPLGPVGPKPWTAADGERRRALCKRMADYIHATYLS